VRLTLDQVVNAVLVSDPKLRSGFEAINQANANALTASLPPNPTLYTDVQLLPLTRPFTVTEQGGPPQYDLQLTQPIDWFLFGKRAANMAREALGVRVAEADFADRVRQRVTDAVVAFYDVLEAKALLDLARQDVANLRRVEAALEKGVAAGGRAVIDLNQVRLDRLRGEQALRDAETALVTAKAKLRAMIGRSDDDPAFDVEGSLDAPLTAVLPPPDEGFALAVGNRPDIESDRRKIAQASADVEAQRRAAFPQVSPQFGYTRQYQTKAIGFPDANSWMAAVTVSLPLYDRNQGNRLKAASTLAQSRFELAADLADLRAEVVTAARELEAARANAEATSGDQLRLAREVLESITTAYQAGGRPLLDFLNAERTFRDTYRAYISARAAYWRAVCRYGAAIGQKITP
jgi:cobalt-zinc-cadmium efflux system outer membrane protein